MILGRIRASYIIYLNYVHGLGYLNYMHGLGYFNLSFALQRRIVCCLGGIGILDNEEQSPSPFFFF